MRTIQEEEGDDTKDLFDLAEQEQYIVPSTGMALITCPSITVRSSRMISTLTRAEVFWGFYIHPRTACEASVAKRKTRIHGPGEALGEGGVRGQIANGH